MYQHIMVPLDGSELAECVLPHLVAIASGCNISRVTIVRVCQPLHLYGGIESRFSPEERHHLEDDEKKLAENYLEQVAQRLKESGITAETAVLYGDIVDSLINFETNNGVDLIVIASHGRSGVKRLVMGSVADRIFRSSSVPVMVVRAPGGNPVSS